MTYMRFFFHAGQYTSPAGQAAMFCFALGRDLMYL